MRLADGTEWLRPFEAAKRLGISRSRIDKWVQRDRVRTVRFNGQRWVCFQDCAKMEAQHRC